MSHPTPPASVPTPPWPAWPPQRVVARLPGSLPMGGVVPGAPIHAFVRTPEPLALQHQPGLNPQRHDIDLGGLLAFVIDDVLTAGEADAVAAASEQFGYRDAAPGIATPPGMRMNKTVHWLADDALMGPMHARIAHLLPPQGVEAGKARTVEREGQDERGLAQRCRAKADAAQNFRASRASSQTLLVTHSGASAM